MYKLRFWSSAQPKLNDRLEVFGHNRCNEPTNNSISSVSGYEMFGYLNWIKNSAVKLVSSVCSIELKIHFIKFMFSDNLCKFLCIMTFFHDAFLS